MLVGKSFSEFRSKIRVKKITRIFEHGQFARSEMLEDSCELPG